MQQDPDTVRGFLATVHPYDALPVDTLEALMPAFRVVPVAAGQPVYTVGEPLEGLCLIRSGSVAVHDANGAQVSQLGPRNSFGERGLMQDGIAVTSAHALEDSQLLILPRAEFLRLIKTEPAAARFFDHQRSPRPRRAELATSRVETLMARDPLTCAPDTTVRDVARMMANRHVSSICVIEDDRLIGIATIRDLSGKVVAGALPFNTPIRDVMTTEPLSLPPSAIGSDVLHMMIERRIGHVPVTRNGRLTGIVTQTDLTRYQAHSPAELVAGIADAPDAKAMARVTARIPQLLAQLVAGGTRHEVTTRLITDIADAVTRRLLRLAEDRLGPPPVPYLWLACGSQGRQEQTGVSDQDNCLILDDTASLEHDAYFAALARVVCDGLNTCGYIYCPGDMMATTARWRQPLHVWQQYFRSWIDSPAPKAQMLASVMSTCAPLAATTGCLATFSAIPWQQQRRIRFSWRIWCRAH